MMKKNAVLSLFVLASVALMGCSPSAASSTSASDSGKASTSDASSTSTSTSTDDGKIRANDGMVVTSTVVNCYMPSPAGLQTKFEADFEAKYPGIDMVITSGTTGELTAKIKAEKANPVCDVLILASWSDGIAAINDTTNYNILAYTPKDSDKLNSAFKESTNKIWGTSASAVGVIYNTDLVQKSTIEALDWADFGNSAKWNASTYPFSIPDPTKSGACKDFLAGFVTAGNGQTVLNSWVSNGITNGGGNKAALASVEGGSIAALIAGVDYNAYSDKKKGQPIDIYYPKSGTVVNPRPAMIMADGAHNDAAKLVMDYLCSEDAQKLVADAYLIPARSDVAAKSDRLGLNDITQFSNMNWNTMAEQGSAIAQNFVDAIKNRG